MSVRAPSVPTFPWQPEATNRGALAIAGIRSRLLARIREKRGARPETLLCGIGALAGFAAQNAALAQGELCGGRPHLVPPGSLMLCWTPSGQRFVLGAWVKAPLLIRYGHAFPLQRFLVKAAIVAGAEPDKLPDFRAMEARIADAVGRGSFGTVSACNGHTLADTPAELLELLWPVARSALLAPLPKDLPHEPSLDEAHWPVIMSAVAGLFLGMSKDTVDPAAGAALIMESAIIASKLDPDVIDPGRWTLGPNGGGLQVARIDRRQAVA
jgi:hypothetical protein